MIAGFPIEALGAIVVAVVIVLVIDQIAFNRNH